LNSVYIGGNAFALFLKNQRQWSYKPLVDEHKTLFVEQCRHHKYDSTAHTIPPIVPHGSYLVNMAHEDEGRATQAYNHFLDDLSRCHKLGIRLYNFHPGNAVGARHRSDALKQIALQLNKAHRDAASGKVITLLETMAAVGGNTIGGTFEELAEIIDLVDDKDRVGVCLDTCHVFAAGYDLRTPEAFKETMDKFEATIGFKYLKALHVNDSKAPLDSGRDLHANIGTGFLGLRSFWNLINEPRILGLPCILETPGGRMANGRSVHSFEIKLLEQLYGMDKESDEFLKMEKMLADQGKSERERVQGQVDRRKTKSPKKGKGKKKEGSDSD
jgi:AP endonuclease-1